MNDIAKQKEFVANKRGTTTKIIRRNGIRKRTDGLETIVVQLIVELRNALGALSQKQLDHATLLEILCRTERTAEDLEILAEYVKGQAKPEPAAEPVPA